MTDLEALYQAILESPDDNTLRLIYADALEEEGDPRRAAFIRTQVQLCHVPEYDPAWVRIRFHDRDKMPGAWLRELPSLPDGLDWLRSHPFRRGLPANVETEFTATFVAHADELFERFPIEAVELANAELSAVREFAAAPWISRLVRLSITEGLGRGSVRFLFGSTHYERLRELHIGAVLTTIATARDVVRSRMFRQLTTLSCRDDRAGGQTFVNELTQLADPPRLRILDLLGNRLNSERVTRLVASPAVSAVEELDLSDNNLRAESLQAIANANLPHLRSLRLLRARPEEAGIEALANSPVLAELRSLTLGGDYLTVPSAVMLAASPRVSNLRVLDLSENRLEDAGAIALANSRHLQNLVHLDLSSNLIEDDGAAALTESPHLEGLIYLNLHGNIISPPIVARLKRRFGDRVFLSP
ncbi:MAG: TIGR02996 domain-containing protein [Planctomycetes bacterium]|nr:TIGR02996 domain-containing protein [Planctomycetota bacterium]